MKNKTMLLAIPKGKKSRFYLKKIRPVQEDDNNYYFLQDEARPVTLERRLYNGNGKNREFRPSK